MRTRARCVGLRGLALLPLLAACQQASAEAGQPRVITVTSPASAVAQGRSVQLVARAFDGDGAVRDVTELVDWRSSQASVATVGERDGTSAGLVRGLGIGSAKIEARLGVHGPAGVLPIAVLRPAP